MSHTLKARVFFDRQAGGREGHGVGGEGEICLAPFCCSYVIFNCEIGRAEAFLCIHIVCLHISTHMRIRSLQELGTHLRFKFQTLR